MHPLAKTRESGPGLRVEPPVSSPAGAARGFPVPEAPGVWVVVLVMVVLVMVVLVIKKCNIHTAAV